MMVRQHKKIPYGITNFETIRTENYLYVDKTRFIEQIENETTKYQFLIRPRKFGKSLFLSVLDHYYDVRYKDKFVQLFGNLYIGRNPTLGRNDFFVLNFEFSGLDTCSIKDFNIAFLEKIKMVTQRFFIDHRDLITNYEELNSKVWNMEKSSNCLEFVFNIVNSFGKKVFIIIDEYDHFANDMIASKMYLGEEHYEKAVWAGSQVRDFYETLKANTRTVIDKIFITGITPVMLDDLTSGFNISNNLSLKVSYNEILGFTEDELGFVMREAGIDKSAVKVDMEYLYNGYLFHVDAKNKLYNPAMMNYFFMGILEEGERMESLVDDNLKTDYGRIRNLIVPFENKTVLKDLVNNGGTPANIVKKFSFINLHQHENFLSLLYYMGLVTISKNASGNPVLKIPNYSVRTNYWEYIKYFINEEIPENTRLPYHAARYFEYLEKLAVFNDPRPFLDFINGNFVEILSNRDLMNFNEKDIKILMMTLIFQSNFYLPVSEVENSGGYCDIYLQRRKVYPSVKSDWVWEVKYIRESDAGKRSLIAKKKKEALEQLYRYKNSTQFKDRTDVRYLAVVFIGRKKYFAEEI